MIDYMLLVLVNSDEDTHFGLIPVATYDKWNNGEIDTGADDHCSLFWSEHVARFPQYLEAIASLDGIGCITQCSGAIGY